MRLRGSRSNVLDKSTSVGCFSATNPMKTAVLIRSWLGSEGRPTDCVWRRSKKWRLASPDAVRVGSDDRHDHVFLARLSRSPCGQNSSAANPLIFNERRASKTNDATPSKKIVWSDCLCNRQFFSARLSSPPSDERSWKHTSILTFFSLSSFSRHSSEAEIVSTPQFTPQFGTSKWGW